MERRKRVTASFPSREARQWQRMAVVLLQRVAAGMA